MKRSELVKTLELVEPALADDNLIAVYTCFMFKQKSISAYNDKLAIIAKGGLPTPEPFATAGKPLLGLLQNSHAEEVDFEATKECLVVKTGKSTFRLPYMKQDEFLFEEPKEKWASTLTLNESILKGVEICLTTASTDLSKPAFLGVCFKFDKNGLTMFSTDGDAITRYTSKTNVKGDESFTVPNGFCEALLKICRETDTNQGTLQLNTNWALATLNNGFRLYGRMILNDKPVNHQQVIDETLNYEQPFVDLPLGLRDALARARVVADIESAKTVMQVDGTKLKLITDTHMGTVRDELRIKNQKDIAAVVHASLVQRSLEVCDQISIRDNCTAYKLEDKVLQVVANVGA